MKDDKFKKWEKIRKLGIVKFTLLYGVLLWGVPVGTFWYLIMQFFIHDEISLYYTLVLTLIICPIGGLVFGKLMWQFSENTYKNHLKH
jgi:hypothetical protein